MSTPIEFMGTGEILKELKNRFDEMVFIGFQSKTAKDDSYTLTAKGSMHGTLGLIDFAKQAAMNDEGD